MLFGCKSEIAFEALKAGLLETMNNHVVDEFKRIEQELRADDQANQLR